MEERFTLTQLENLDRDNVHIRCIDSTDFVLGSQTNFNGPVTIVNCPDVLKGNRPLAEERIVIREDLLSRSALTEIRGIATMQTGVAALPDSTTVLPPFADDRPTSNKSRYGLILLCVGLLAATVASAPIFVTVASTEDHPEEEPKASKCTPLPNNICIYSRFCWGGRPISAATERPLEVAATYLVVSQTYDDYCYEHSACLEAVQNFQLNGTADAACNFLLGGDGNVYEDRGWELVALPDALRICFMGDFVLDYPTYPQVEAAKALIQFARERNYLVENYVLLGWKVSVPLYKVIYRWPRFSNETLAIYYTSKMDSPTPEGDVTIECLQSSQFVVGKQTDFNGPVTIINCAHAPPKERRQEKILIRDKVHVPPDVPPTSHKRRSSAILLTFVLICVGLTATAAVCLALLLPKAPTKGNLSSVHPVYSKDDWEGRPAKSIVKMKFPIPYVVVSHTVTPLCHGLKTCGALIRNMQSYHFGLQYADIGYNFLVDSSGSIYEGRGWDRRNVKGGFVNGRNIDIALIGDYSDAVKPTREMMDGLRHLLDVGLAEGKISQRYSLIAANSTYATLSPGKNVYDVIKQWPRFDPHPEAHIKEYEE